LTTKILYDNIFIQSDSTSAYVEYCMETYIYYYHKVVLDRVSKILLQEKALASAGAFFYVKLRPAIYYSRSFVIYRIINSINNTVNFYSSPKEPPP
jgi:hypothetical protein